MLKLRKNKRKDLYIFFVRRDVRKLTCLTAKFQEDPTRKPLREKLPGEVMVYDEHLSFETAKKCCLKNWMSMLYCRRYADFVLASLFNQIIMCPE